MTTRRDFLALSTGLAAAALGAPALAEQWPAKPIRAIVPFGPGSTIDIIGRIVLEPLSQALGQPIVVENRGGAGGSIGSAAVAKSDPDGYTLLIHASAHSAAPAVYPHLSYDVARDFAGVAVFGTVPNVTVISPAKGIKTLKELVEAAKKRSMTFASAGVGSATHWAAERLKIAAGFNALHVPFKGGPEALTQVASGAAESTPYVMVTNLARTLEELKERNIWVVGADERAEQTLYRADLPGAIAWVLGAEGEGMRRLTRESCDMLVRIPMGGEVESLNVSVSAGICLFESVRRRQEKKR
jgi:tripartite-type tricarboxylate transporter receptor subunit TctC